MVECGEGVGWLSVGKSWVVESSEGVGWLSVGKGLGG